MSAAAATTALSDAIAELYCDDAALAPAHRVAVAQWICYATTAGRDGAINEAELKDALIRMARVFPRDCVPVARVFIESDPHDEYRDATMRCVHATFAMCMTVACDPPCPERSRVDVADCAISAVARLYAPRETCEYIARYPASCARDLFRAIVLARDARVVKSAARNVFFEGRARSRDPIGGSAPDRCDRIDHPRACPMATPPPMSMIATIIMRLLCAKCDANVISNVFHALYANAANSKSRPADAIPRRAMRDQMCAILLKEHERYDIVAAIRDVLDEDTYASAIATALDEMCVRDAIALLRARRVRLGGGAPYHPRDRMRATARLIAVVDALPRDIRARIAPLFA